MSLFDKVFRRNRDEESEDLSIYKDEPSTNRFASFLFGFFALLVTLLIAAGLFFGGRAVYRALNGDSTENVATPDNKNTTASTKSEASKSSDSKNQKSKQTSSTPSTGDNLPSTGDNLPLPKTGDPGM